MLNYFSNAPLDGSLPAECVLPHVRTIGRVFDAKIMLLQVLDKDRADVSTQRIDLINWKINKKVEAKLYLQRIGDQLQNSGLQTKANVLEGSVVEEITEFAQSQDMKLIILSSHGHSHGFTKVRQSSFWLRVESKDLLFWQNLFT